MEPGLLKSADWPVLIDLYFFLGGLAGGAFVIATVANLVDPGRYRPIVRVGYYVAFLALLPCPILLILDLGLPTRFLHMLMASKSASTIGEGALTLGPFHLKPYSPMSAGAWALMGFSLLSFLTALDVFIEDRGGRSIDTLRLWAGVIGGFFAFFIAAYPGVLLGATARPLFVNGHWLGALFLAVGASTGAGAIALVLSVRGPAAAGLLSRLMWITAFALVLEVLGLTFFAISVSTAGSAGLRHALGQLVAGPYGLAFWLGAVVIGLLAPLALQLSEATRRASPWMAAAVGVLVLVGGFVLKYVLVAAGQAS